MATSSNLKDKDIVQWLENKFSASSCAAATGEFSGLWGSRHFCPSVNQELLTEIPSCFVDLQIPTKLKLLLSFLHLTKRNLDQWRDEIEDILSLASQDTDEWVQTIAELLKELPTTGGLSLTMNNEDGQFAKALLVLKKILKRQVKEACQMLPLDASFVNKSSVQTIWGTTAQPSKHFALKRKPKAAAQRVELLQKSLDTATQMKNKGRGVCSNMVPIKERNMVRKMDATGPLPKIPMQSAVKSSLGFNNNSKIYNRPTVTKKEGGVKLIDITETPEMLRKKRKAVELEEKAAKKAAKEETKRQKMELKERKKSQLSESIDEETLVEEEDNKELESVQSTPNYAADLFEATLPALPTSTVDEANNLPTVIPPSPSVKPGITVKPHFTPLPSSQVPAASTEITVANVNASIRPNPSRASVIMDPQLSSVTTPSAAPQPPSLYSNFAAAFMQPQSAGHNRISTPQQFIRATIPHSDFSSTPSSSQGMQMVRITLGGQPQTVILQNPSLQPLQQTQGKAVFVVGQTGLRPASMASSSSMLSLNDLQRKDVKTEFGSLNNSKMVNIQNSQVHPSAISSAHSRSIVNTDEKSPNLHHLSPMNNVSAAPPVVPSVNGPTTAQFVLTKEIMCQAQDMFRTANKLSRPEKALILGFMAGNRENPCPQMGNILTVRLEENQDNQLQTDGTVKAVLIETFFQMNYESGEWKKIRKMRPLPVGEC